MSEVNRVIREMTKNITRWGKVTRRQLTMNKIEVIVQGTVNLSIIHTGAFVPLKNNIGWNSAIDE